MSDKKDITLNLIAFLTAAGFIIGLTFVLRNFLRPSNSDSDGVFIKGVSPTSTTTPKSIEMEIQISSGNKILIDKEESNVKNAEFQLAKGEGVKAMASGHYDQAIPEFEKAIQKYRNAPETLIYLNNARVGNNKAYTIALVAPIGDDVDSALKLLRGVAQAQNEINQSSGKINGIPLKILIADDQGKTEIAKQVATELSKNPEILGVIGHHSSGTSLAAREVYESDKLVAISSTSTSVKLSEPAANSLTRYVFRTVPNDALAAKSLAKYMLEKLKKRKAVIFYDPNSAYSMSLKKEFIGEVSQSQGEIIDEFQISDKDFNAFKNVKQAIDKKAEVAMLAVPYNQLKQALSVINVNNKKLSILGGDATYNIKILQEGGSRAEGMVVAMAWHRDTTPNSIFVQESQKLWNANVDWKTAMTYDAAQALIAALKINPTRTGIQQALLSPDFQVAGVANPIKFEKYTGDRIGRLQLVQIKAVANSSSGTGYDFVPLP